MLENNWLTRKWREFAENQRVTAHHAAQEVALLNAIGARDVGKLDTIIADMQAIDKLAHKRVYRLLETAMAYDDVSMFTKILDMAPQFDTNLQREDHWTALELGSGYTKTPLLIAALNNGAVAVAGYLAMHANTDVTLREYSQQYLCAGGISTDMEEFGDKASVLAMKIGAHGLAEHLRIREDKALQSRIVKTHSFN